MLIYQGIWLELLSVAKWFNYGKYVAKMIRNCTYVCFMGFQVDEIILFLQTWLFENASISDGTLPDPTRIGTITQVTYRVDGRGNPCATSTQSVNVC